MLLRFLPLTLLPVAAAAQTTDPAITSWLLNPNNTTGYNGLVANVQQVQYSAANVYVSCTSIPTYSIGPWPGNPNQTTSQTYLFKIPRMPVPHTGAATPTPLGPAGLWRNGVTMFNAKDARSYLNQDVWHQNAIVVEGPGFDSCLGHPNQTGAYHHHLNPKCLYNDRDSAAHAPLLGYALDGYPIYGTYGYRNAATGTGGIKSLKSAYRLRSITQRTTLPGGAAAPAAGPPVSAQYPLGYYVEDYEYVAGRGDLDQYNGRFGRTPEYPNGTYAYFVTLNSFYEGAYPYVVGPTYYGVVPPGRAGQATITEPVTTYVLSTRLAAAGYRLVCAPNPAAATVQLRLSGPVTGQPFRARLLDGLGRPVGSALTLPATGQAVALDVQALAPGIYFLWLEGNGLASAEKILVGGR